MKEQKQQQNEKVVWKNSRCIFLAKNYEESMEKQMNSTGTLS